MKFAIQLKALALVSRCYWQIFCLSVYIIQYGLALCGLYIGTGLIYAGTWMLPVGFSINVYNVLPQIDGLVTPALRNSALKYWHA